MYYELTLLAAWAGVTTFCCAWSDATLTAWALLMGVAAVCASLRWGRLIARRSRIFFDAEAKLFGIWDGTRYAVFSADLAGECECVSVPATERAPGGATLRLGGETPVTLFSGLSEPDAREIRRFVLLHAGMRLPSRREDGEAFERFDSSFASGELPRGMWYDPLRRRLCVRDRRPIGWLWLPVALLVDFWLFRIGENAWLHRELGWGGIGLLLALGLLASWPAVALLCGAVSIEREGGQLLYRRGWMRFGLPCAKLPLARIRDCCLGFVRDGGGPLRLVVECADGREVLLRCTQNTEVLMRFLSFIGRSVAGFRSQEPRKPAGD